MNSYSDILPFWAKSGDAEKDGSITYHPVICHMIDTSNVVLVMWEKCLSPKIKALLAKNLGMKESDAGKFIAFFCGLHDSGKIYIFFVSKWQPGMDAVIHSGYSLPLNPCSKTHGTVTGKVLIEILKKKFNMPLERAISLSIALGGHHGLFPSENDISKITLKNIGEDWLKAIEKHVDILADLLEIDQCSLENVIMNVRDTNTFDFIIAGLTTVTDWIASSKEYFPPAGSYLKSTEDTQSIKNIILSEYVESSKQQAVKALHELGWVSWKPDDKQVTFFDLFGFLDNDLRPLQVAATKIAPKLDNPGLVLIEAPMGEGKTETALFLYEKWQLLAGQRGCYFALPTQATSNQLFDRMVKFIRRRYSEQVVNLGLLHSQAELSAEYRKLRLAAIEQDKGEELGQVVAEEWFAKKKRGLLAPFAVGTIDQSLLSVLKIKHCFVRLFGLSAKVVVLDEIHSYDLYTTSLIKRMLEWFAAMGTSVVILSATLPRTKRLELLNAYGEFHENENVLYPRISWVTNKSWGSVPFGARPNRGVYLSFKEPEFGKVCNELVKIISQNGGCGAWICNTIKSAQNIYDKLTNICQEKGIEVILFHSRYPFEEKMKLENKIKNSFGTKSLIELDDPDYCKRPEKAIVVATQVIEQSLDVDFDIMVSELAPIDLILQRSGRLQRHCRKRPPCFNFPYLWIISPQVKEEMPDFGSDGCVYYQYILLLSWLTLKQISSKNQGHIRIPEDMEDLIESVYSNERQVEIPGYLSEIARKWQADLTEKLDEEAKYARNVMVKSPDTEEIFYDFTQDLEEENPEVHRSLQAMTRLCEPSVQVACLFKKGGRLSITKDMSKEVRLDTEPDNELTKAILNRSVTLSHKTIVFALFKKAVPKGWKRNPLLRNHRIIEFEEGAAEVDGVQILLDDAKGIVIQDGKE
jgi:CRISPR-associated endonuclease/helicase Cas3